MKKALTEIIKFNEERDWDQFHSPENLAKSIAIEAGELLECFQWGPDYDHQKVCEELADVMNYCLLMSDKLGVDAETIILQKRISFCKTRGQALFLLNRLIQHFHFMKLMEEYFQLAFSSKSLYN